MIPVTEPIETPRTVGEVDDSLHGTIKGLHRLRWWLIAIVGCALVAGVIALGVISLQQQRELQASCGFWANAGSSPVVPMPPAKVPSPLGVKLIADSRIAYYHQGCSPALPPNPTLQRWAAYYGVPYLP